MNEFYKTVSTWLMPLGYKEIFSNHPNSTIREFHFAKDGIRVVCVTDFQYDKEGYCYLLNEIYGFEDKVVFSLRTDKIRIESSNLESLHVFLNNEGKKIKKNYYKFSKIS